MIHIVIIICLLLILFVLLRSREKFTNKLKPPHILKVKKEGEKGFVEWYHSDKKVKEYVLLYVDVEKLKDGVWMETEIECPNKRCKVVLDNLKGNKYKLAVLSKLDNQLSEITQQDIVTFSDEKEYHNIGYETQPAITAQGDDTEMNFNNDSDIDSESELVTLEVQTLVSTPALSEEVLAPAPAPVPLIDCSGGYVKTSNIDTEEDLKAAKVKSSCNEMENLSEYVESPFHHYYWDKIF